MRVLYIAYTLDRPHFLRLVPSSPSPPARRWFARSSAAQVRRIRVLPKRVLRCSATAGTLRARARYPVNTHRDRSRHSSPSVLARCSGFPRSDFHADGYTRLGYTIAAPIVHPANARARFIHFSEQTLQSVSIFPFRCNLRTADLGALVVLVHLSVWWYIF